MTTTIKVTIKARKQKRRKKINFAEMIIWIAERQYGNFSFLVQICFYFGWLCWNNLENKPVLFPPKEWSLTNEYFHSVHKFKPRRIVRNKTFIIFRTFVQNSLIKLRNNNDLNLKFKFKTRFANIGSRWAWFGLC